MAVPVDAAAIILAGGKSRRLGRDKASEVLTGRSLLQHVIDRCEGLVSQYVVVVARGQNMPAVESGAPMVLVEDVYPETGPLGGLYTGLGAAQMPLALVLACDTPLLQPALLAELLRVAPGHEAVAPLRNGLPEPLCAVYSGTCVEVAKGRLERGELRLTSLFDDLDALLLAEEEWRRFDPDGLSFLNVNREDDLQRARELLQERASEA